MSIHVVKKEACKECPFKRDALQGYLGAADNAEDFINPHWNADLPLPCHMTVDWEADNAQDVAKEKPLCRGLLIMMRNSAKMPRDLDLEKARKSVQPDYENFFSFPNQFVEFHNGK